MNSDTSRRGFYIVIETIDGGGKDTLIKGIPALYVQEFLGIELVLVEEPNEHKNRMGAYIRSCLKDSSLVPSDPLVFQEYYMVDRYTTMVCDVAPALERGAVVLSNRSYLSTLAYGSIKLPISDVSARHHEMLKSVMVQPDLALLVDVVPEEGARRIERSGKDKDYFEKDLEVQAKVRGAYLTLMQESSARYPQQHRVIIDGMAVPEVVLERAWSVIGQHLRQWNAAHNMRKD